LGEEDDIVVDSSGVEEVGGEDAEGEDAEACSLHNSTIRPLLDWKEEEHELDE
jgi:hypothetical protein